MFYKDSTLVQFKSQVILKKNDFILNCHIIYTRGDFMKDLYKVREGIKKHKIDFDTIEIVLHSYHILANEYKLNNEEKKELECYSKKEIIMEYLLTPTEIHIIKGNKYLVYEGLNHKFHEPFTSLSEEEQKLYGQILPIVKLNKWNYSGNRIKGRLDKEQCDEFYNMIIENDFIFEMLS